MRRALFKLAQLPLGRFDDRRWNTRQSGDGDAVTLISRAFFERVQKDDALAVFYGVQMHVNQRGVFVGEQSKLKIMRRKQR